MPYNISKFDNNSLQTFTIADGTLNTTATTLKLPGLNYPGYGQPMDQNVVDLTQNFARYTTPDNMIEGQMWYTSTIPTDANNAATGNLYLCTSNIGGANGRSWAKILTSKDTIVATQLANAVTFTNTGTGAAPGTPFNGNPAITVSWNTVGAASGDANGRATSINVPVGNLFITGGTAPGQVLTLSGVANGNVSWTFPSFITGSGRGMFTANGHIIGDWFMDPLANLTGGNATSPTYMNGNWQLGPGTRLNATYADFAERFESDAHYDPGTVVELGGEREITAVREELSEHVFGVISNTAAFLLNGAAGNDVTHPAVAISGRVTVKVNGQVRKGDRLVSAGNGIARAAKDQKEVTAFNTIGRALVDKPTDDLGTVLAIVMIK